MKLSTTYEHPVVKHIVRSGLTQAVVQALGLVGQLLVAYWLMPDDFGYWALATSSLFVCTAALNLGESARLASSATATLPAAMSRTRIPNYFLAGIGLIVSLLLTFRSSDAAVAAAMIALTIPAAGRSQLFFAQAMRERSVLPAVLRAQVIVTLGRVVVLVALASTLKSVVALGLAFALHAAIWSLVLGRIVVDGNETVAVEDPLSPSVRTRATWALQNFSQVFPGQADYLVMGLVGDPSDVGIYYLAYQGTVAIGNVLGAPMAKILTSEFAKRERGAHRQRLGLRTSTAILLGGNTVFTPVAILVLVVGSSFQGYWAPALMVAAVLLTALPARLLSPVSDGYLLAADRWSRSTVINCVDAVGTGVLASLILVLPLLQVAALMGVWKALVGWARSREIFVGARRAVWSLVLCTAGPMGMSAWVLM